ncbi:MAG: DUF502 domain-containing protein [Desulfatiglans sp.]|jgi:uncharacterized membrane protein|nr:DUF502 domain-containing protein [Thermodesulfobacteriota bacterium]MEE4351809.1 DUF502 domain-containing protein [Desulfatiglans sp.]
MKKLSKTFLTGLVAILPILATIYILLWLMITAEVFLGKGIRIILPEQFYWPGMGVIAGIVVIFLSGALLQAWMVRKLFEWGEGLIYRIPFVKSVYGSFRDFLHFVSAPDKKADNSRQVVMVKIGNTDMEIMGLVTRRDFKGLPDGIGTEAHVAVYIPMSYQIGGHTVIVPKSSIRPVETSMEQAMRFMLTAGMMTKHPDIKTKTTGSGVLKP